MSKLEKFIQQNRQEFDSQEPRPDLWRDIETRLHAEKPPIRATVRPLWFRTPLMRYAAAAMVVLVAGYGIYQLGRYSKQSEIAANPATLAQVNPELAQAETYYTALISEQQLLLNPQELQSLGLADDFSSDLASLDSTYKNLKTALLTEPNKDPVVAAMIQNLQLRVEIIRQQIETLQRIRSYRKDSKAAAQMRRAPRYRNVRAATAFVWSLRV